MAKLFDKINEYKLKKDEDIITIHIRAATPKDDRFENNYKGMNLGDIRSISSVVRESKGTAKIQIVFDEGVQLIDLCLDEKEAQCIYGIQFPNSTLAINQEAFCGCINLKEVDLSHTKITEIGQNAFSYSGVTDVVLPDCLEKIGKEAFSNSKITSINLPSDLKVLGLGCFKETENLQSMDLSMLKIKELPSDIFSHSSIKRVVLPRELETIGEDAFTASAIEELDVPDSLREIQKHAFGATEKLTKLDLTNTRLETILPETFIDSTIEELLLPDTIKKYPNGLSQMSISELLDVMKKSQIDLSKIRKAAEIVLNGNEHNN